MTNYVFHKILCSKNFLDNYLLDYYPLGKDKKIYPPYISFNKLVGVFDLGEYLEHFDGSMLLWI